MSDRLISADALRQRMYHDAFETDTEMQRWDGGCWIRYKMFENALEDAPIIDAESVVRCKDCKYRTVDNDVARYNCGLHLVVSLNDNDFCSRGERRENETD